MKPKCFWFEGTIKEFKDPCHLIEYEDGDVDWIDLLLLSTATPAFEFAPYSCDRGNATIVHNNINDKKHCAVCKFHGDTGWFASHLDRAIEQIAPESE